ncbi:hypothetical protein TSAR_008999, partial [Trichomalopsis sarcophagae]
EECFQCQLNNFVSIDLKLSIKTIKISILYTSLPKTHTRHFTELLKIDAQDFWFMLVIYFNFLNHYKPLLSNICEWLQKVLTSLSYKLQQFSEKPGVLIPSFSSLRTKLFKWHGNHASGEDSFQCQLNNFVHIDLKFGIRAIKKKNLTIFRINSSHSERSRPGVFSCDAKFQIFGYKIIRITLKTFLSGRLITVPF